MGVSTVSRDIELSAEDFNAYLRHDGVLDILAARMENGTLNAPVREHYSKHVKAIVQVGDRRSGSYSYRLDYPIEIVPQQNPYELQTGDDLDVLVLRNGKPVNDQIVYASYEGYQVHDEEGNRREAVQTRTNGEGIARIPLNHDGRWYVRLIHMVPVAENNNLDYESNWATLTFEIK